MEADGRIVILSDTHLGRRRGGAGSAQSLEPLMEGATQLIINGDVAEVADAGCRAEAARQVLELRDLCEQRGIELTLIAGNHDPMISRHRSLNLCGGQVHLTHGDVLHPDIAPWAPYAMQLRQQHQRTMQIATQSYGDLSADEAMAPHQEAARYASHFEWNDLVCDVEPMSQGPAGWIGFARMAVVAPYYWWIMPGAAARYAAFHVPQSRFFIFGHIHHAGIWTWGHRTVINTGSFGLPGRPRGVIIENDSLSVEHITRRGSHWQWRGKTQARFTLDPTND